MYIWWMVFLAKFLFPYRNIVLMEKLDDQLFRNTRKNFSAIGMSKNYAILYDEDIAGLFLCNDIVTHHDCLADTFFLCCMLGQTVWQQIQ